ncbi:MAG: TraR/DksA C4-type zinc finger protein [Nitrospirae bacterium]|nr:TraR/DksA C4-type zinc finger protein [Nitrospirota bacterium]
MPAKKATKTPKKKIKKLAKNTKKIKTPDKKTIKKVAKKTVKRVAKKPSLKPKIKTKTKTKTKIKIKAKTKPKPVQRKKITRFREKISEDEKKAALRKALILKREEILKETKLEISKYIKGETRQLVDTALDNGDWSVIDLSEDISLKQLGNHRENLFKIDEALRKLDEGTYGKCEDCGGDISEKRLKVLPYAIYCIDCKEKREQLEKMESKEGPV